MSELEVEALEPGIVGVTLNRPHRRNALTPALTDELHAAFDRIASDAACRAVILTGTGPAFCSGVDMRTGPGDPESRPAGHTVVGELIGRVEGEVARHLAVQEHMASLMEKVHRLRQPVIAAVNGPAVGGGLALALAADVRIAAPEARFAVSFVKRGVSGCDMGTSYLLPRLVGGSRAAELMLTGRTFDAEEAVAMGLVHRIVPAAELVEAAVAKAQEIGEHSPLAVWMTKETMWQTIDAPSLRHAIDVENRTQIMCLSSGELREAFAAFADGRRAEWRPL